MSDTEYQQLVRIARAELSEKQERFTSAVGPDRHFDWSQDRAQIAFSAPGKSTLIADIQFVGDVSKTSRTWLWAWANPSVDEGLKRDVRRVREFGEAKGIERLVLAKWNAYEVDGWEMTSIAAKVLRSDAAYRTEGPKGYVFMLLWRLRQAPEGFQVDHSSDNN